MSNQRQESRPGPPRVSWRGGAVRERTVLRHRWQRDWTATPERRLRFRQQWLRRRLLLMTAVFAGLLGLLAFLLLQSPVQTPLIAAVATAYEAPLPVNAWAWEDLQALGALDGKSLRVLDVSRQCTTSERALESIGQQLAQLKRRERSFPCVILYVSMAGAVDDKGRSCLIPPGASAYDATTWLRVEDLLLEFKKQEIPEAWKKLVVIDYGRSAATHALGIVDNRFAAKLPDAVTVADIPGLAVLCAAQSGQRAWTSETWGQSVFGRYWQQALAGVADQTAAGGNGDRRVSLQEAHRYVLREVDRWAGQQRASRQQPVLIPASADFELTWSLRREPAPRVAPTPSVPTTEIVRLWEVRERLDEPSLLRVDPDAWHGVERQLQRLTEIAHAGEAYADEARRSQERLAKRLETWTQQQRSLQGAHSDLAWSAVASGGEAWFKVQPKQVHSLALAQSLNTAKVADLEEAYQRFQSVIADPQPQSVEDALEAMQRQDWPALAEVQQLRLLRRYALLGKGPATAQVIAARVEGEKLAAPADIRLQAWIRPQTMAADVERRQGEDALYAADSTAQATIDAATRSYAQAASDATTVAQSLRTCDEACAELPAWIAWLTEPLPGAALATLREELLRKSLGPALTETHSLAEQLAKPPQSVAEAQQVAALGQMAESLAAHLRELHLGLDGRLQQLAASADPQQWPSDAAELESLLALPLLTSPQRKQALARYETVALALAAKADQTGTPVATAGGEGEAKEREEALTDLAPSIHPLVTCLAPICDDAGETTQLELDTRLRAALHREASERAPSLGRTMQEHAARLAAAIGIPLRTSQVVAKERRHAWQEFWIWHALRTADDFLGPVTPDKEPFFALAAEDELHLARSAVANDEPAFETQLHDASTLLSSRRAAARSGAKTTTSDALILFAGEPTRTRIGVSPTPESPGLATGRLGMFIHDASGAVVTAQIKPVEGEGAAAELITPLTMPADFTLNGDSIEGTEALLSVTAHLRGNEFSAPLVVRAANGPTVMLQPVAERSSRVTVAGGVRKRPAIIFVLDCSQSMRAPVRVEAVDGQQLTRLQIAQNALQTMLNQLAREGDAYVGVKLLGHRVGWTTEAPLRLARQPKYGRAIGDDVRPHADVENVLELGRFGPLEAGEVSSVMKTVVPWGESPLYLAVIQSLQELAGQEDVDANVIVITDGNNYQFIPSTTDQVPAGTTQSIDDVLKAAKGKSARVHIVGFDIAREEADRAREEFSRIAEATGGSYQMVDQAGRLITQLEALLGDSSFAISKVDRRGQQTTPEMTELGNPATVTIPASGEAKFAVDFRQAQADLLLRGGENVLLRLARGNRRLVAEPFAGGPAVTAAFVQQRQQGVQQTNYRFHVHRPVRVADGVKLTCSLTDDSGLYFPRPAEIWIEATPLTSSGSVAGPTHFYYDSIYLNDTSTPAVEWTMQPWPRAATRVSVRCFARASSVEPTVRMPLLKSARDHREQSDPALAKRRWIVDVDPPTSARGTFEVRVAAWFDGSEEYFPVKLQVAAPSPQSVPLRIERVFDAANRVSAHRFVFSAETMSPEELELQLTSREAVIIDAWRLEQPVVATIDDGVELLPPQ